MIKATVRAQPAHASFWPGRQGAAWGVVPRVTSQARLPSIFVWVDAEARDGMCRREGWFRGKSLYHIASHGNSLTRTTVSGQPMRRGSEPKSTAKVPVIRKALAVIKGLA